MFTKFEFPKSEMNCDREEEGSGELPVDGGAGATSPSSCVPSFPALPGGGNRAVVDSKEDSCNMWHLFNYHDESCVDLTDVYSNGGIRVIRNCSTPAPGAGPTPTTIPPNFDPQDLSSSSHRVSCGGGGSDAHDASWLCVVNMADLHSQDSSAAADSNLRHFETASRPPPTSANPPRLPPAIPFSAQSAVTLASDGAETRLLQFTAVSSAPRASTSQSVTVSSAPSIITLSDFRDYRVQIKQDGGATGSVPRVTGELKSGVTSSGGVSRPILVLTSVSSAADRSPARPYPKPAYSYSCLIAMALKNSQTGVLPVNEIYAFMTDHFPYFQTAPDGWKNSVRHNLSLNKCFRKIDNPNTTGHARKGCLWGLNESRIVKMDEEIVKWRKKDPEGIRRSMVYPDRLEAIERGNINSAAAAASTAAFVFGDDVLVDLYTEPGEGAVTAQRIDDFFEELVGRGGSELKVERAVSVSRPQQRLHSQPGVGSQPAAITFVRSARAASVGGAMGSKGGSRGTAGGGPLIGLMAGSSAGAAVTSRPFATIKAEF